MLNRLQEAACVEQTVSRARMVRNKAKKISRSFVSRVAWLRYFSVETKSEFLESCCSYFFVWDYVVVVVLTLLTFSLYLCIV